MHDPGMSCAALKRLSQSTVTESDDLSRIHHLQSLEMQGECFRSVDSSCYSIWIAAVQALPDFSFKFALKATLDTLPHNKNLHKWKKLESSNCPLCGKVQSLLHVLNNCNVSLNQWRYDNRHNTILTRIKSIIESHCSDYHLIADLPDCPYNRPDFLISDLRPDIVIWNTDKKKCFLIELTVFFDTISDRALERKMLRYVDLSEHIQSSGYSCTVLPLQVGSRGFIDLSSFEPLRSFLRIKSAPYQMFLREVATDAVIGSFQIWSRRNCIS